MPPNIAMIILISLLILFWSGIIYWLLYITIKNISPYRFSKENNRFLIFSVFISGSMIAIYDYTPAGPSDLERLDRHFEQAKRDQNNDLLFKIREVKKQKTISMREIKYIEKMIEKGI